MSNPVGRQVSARRDLHSGWFGTAPTVRRGARGIIRDTTPGGFFSGPRYVVEFLSGTTIEVADRDVRMLLMAGGERDFATRQTIVGGVKIGFLVLTAIALVPYFLFQHGSVSGLILAMPGALLSQISDLIIVLGLPTFLICAAAFVLWHRVRR
jgi:hypothetical protein